jgi:hypothetical protein
MNSYLQRQFNPEKNNRNKMKTRNPQYQNSNLIRLSGQKVKINNTSVRRKNPTTLPVCLFDGPFLSICYNRRPVCRSDEITCKKDGIYCCYKPLCDILPVTDPVPISTTEIVPTLTHPHYTTSGPSVDYCDLHGNYVLVCTEPDKYPQCPFELDGDIQLCKMRKPYTNKFVFCCYKEMRPMSTTIVYTSTTTHHHHTHSHTHTHPITPTTPTENIVQECTLMG